MSTLDLGTDLDVNVDIEHRFALRGYRYYCRCCYFWSGRREEFILLPPFAIWSGCRFLVLVLMFLEVFQGP